VLFLIEGRNFMQADKMIERESRLAKMERSEISTSRRAFKYGMQTGCKRIGDG
jgi:hypothetical protein